MGFGKFLNSITKGFTLGLIDPNGDADRKKRAQAAADAAAAAAKKAAHDAEVMQLAQGMLGPTALRKRKGPYATLLTGTPTLSVSSPQPTGKTLLSQ